MDSFSAYEQFSTFVDRPLEDLIIDGHSDLNYFKTILRKYKENIVGEVRNNCQAHDDPGNIDIYLHTIGIKLINLHDQLFNPSWGGHYKFHADNIIEIEFMDTIEATFSWLIGLVRDFPRKSRKKELTSVKGKQNNQQLRFHSLKTIDEITHEDLKGILNTLKSYKFKSIDPETTDSHFIQCFSGEKVEFKVRWLRINVLQYFITSFAYKGLLLSPANRIWELSSQCFVDKNGHDLTAKQLGKADPPKSTSIKNVIDGITDDLRKTNTR